MFNVWTYEISYTRTSKVGVLAGIPCHCTVGVSDELAGKKHFENLIDANPDVVFNDYKITKKR